MYGWVGGNPVAALGAVLVMFGAATAHADPGDPPVPPGAPVPTVEQVVAVLNTMTDPNTTFEQKSAVLEPPLPPDRGEKVDVRMHDLGDHGYYPFNWVVTDIQPAPADYAGATVSIPHHPWTPPGPVVLVLRDGQWKMTLDTAMTALNAIWANATWTPNVGGGSPPLPPFP